MCDMQCDGCHNCLFKRKMDVPYDETEYCFVAYISHGVVLKLREGKYCEAWKPIK